MSSLYSLGNAFHHHIRFSRTITLLTGLFFFFMCQIFAFHTLLQKMFHKGFQLFLYGCSKYSSILFNFCYLCSYSFSFCILYFLISFIISEKVGLLALICLRSTNNFLCKIRTKFSYVLFKSSNTFLRKDCLKWLTRLINLNVHLTKKVKILRP